MTDAHPDIAHRDALNRTGFWGKEAAGSILLAKSTLRLGIAHRSQAVEQPGTHGTVGGALDPGEDPRQAAIAETLEEVGYHFQPADHLEVLDVFESGDFRYTTFLHVIEREFRPVLNWECRAFAFYEFGHWPQPLHFGLAATFRKPACIALIAAEIARCRGT